MGYGHEAAGSTPAPAKRREMDKYVRLGEEIMIEKIEQTLDVVIPFVILLLSAFQLAGLIAIVDKAAPVLYGLLAALQAVFKIWGITLRLKHEAGLC